MVVVASALAVAGALVAGSWLMTGTRWLDVSDKPEFAVALSELRAVPACELRYGEPHRGMNAEVYRFARVWAEPCDGGLRVGVPVDAHAGSNSRFTLERSSVKDAWTLKVDPTAADATSVARALTAFAPVLIARTGPMLEKDKADLEHARREREAREAEEQARRAANAESFR